jgi:type II secretory ATPase GspE/PulE/Tfp pilus assembly ATPase PilB-like protein
LRRLLRMRRETSMDGGLQVDGLSKAAQGITTIEEVLRTVV